MWEECPRSFLKVSSRSPARRLNDGEKHKFVNFYAFLDFKRNLNQWESNAGVSFVDVEKEPKNYSIFLRRRFNSIPGESFVVTTLLYLLLNLLLSPARLLNKNIFTRLAMNFFLFFLPKSYRIMLMIYANYIFHPSRHRGEGNDVGLYSRESQIYLRCFCWNILWVIGFGCLIYFSGILMIYFHSF